VTVKKISAAKVAKTYLQAHGLLRKWLDGSCY
jgi:hypothetical protein